MGREKIITYLEGVYLRLFFGCLKTTTIKTYAKNRATIDAHGYDHIARLVSDYCCIPAGISSYRREVCVARLQGWAVVGLKSRDEQQVWLSRFLVYILNINYLSWSQWVSYLLWIK